MFVVKFEELLYKHMTNCVPETPVNNASFALEEILRRTTEVKERAIFIEFKAPEELICEHSYLHKLSNMTI